MTGADRPPKDAYLLNVLRRRDDVLWAGERERADVPTVIARGVEAIRAQLPAAAGAGWHWVESAWSWADVKTASAGITRLGTRIRSVSVGPREDDTFGITLELDGPDEAVEAYVATLEPGLVRIAASASSNGGRPPGLSPTFGSAAFGSAGFGSAGFPFADARDLPLDDPRPGPDGLPPRW